MLNKFSFGQGNFVNAYVTGDAGQVVVEVSDLRKVPDKAILNPCFAEQQQEKYMIYDIPVEFHWDVMRVMEGKYSTISNTAKDMIRQYSGLNYKLGSPVNGITVYHTDARLRALDRDERLRQTIEDYLDVVINPKSELLSPPNMDNEQFEKVLEGAGAQV